MTASSTLDDALTDRQLRFVFEYLIDQNASAAAARAGYSEKSRASQANELMKNEAVRERIRLELASLLAEAGCSEMQLILERRRAAFFRAEQMLGAGWEPLPPGEMAEEVRRAVEVCTAMGRGGPVVKVRQPDRHKALRALERVHERLEKANEAYWARLEKEGRCRSLVEIEAMDAQEGQAGAENGEKSWDLYGGTGEGAAAQVVENAEKDGGLSGFGQRAAPFDRLRANGSGRGISEKPAGLSGDGQRAAPFDGLRANGDGRVISEKPAVLSGDGQRAAPFDRLRANGSGRGISEKPAVLSGDGQGAAPFDGLKASGSGWEISETPAELAGGAGAPAGRMAVPNLILKGVADLAVGPARGAVPAPARAAANRKPLAAHNQSLAANNQPLAAHWLMRNAPPPSGLLRVA
jgi:phage terminase small subunit